MRDTEHLIAVAFYQWWCYNSPRWDIDSRLLYAVPNGGQRNIIVARKLKAEGVRSGVSDYILDVARGGYHGLRLELKSEKGRATEEQLEFGRLVQEQGFDFRIVYGTDEAIEAVEKYLGAKC